MNKCQAHDKSVLRLSRHKYKNKNCDIRIIYRHVLNRIIPNSNKTITRKPKLGLITGTA